MYCIRSDSRVSAKKLFFNQKVPKKTIYKIKKPCISNYLDLILVYPNYFDIIITSKNQAVFYGIFIIRKNRI